MKTLKTANIPIDQLNQLEEFAASAGPELQDVLMSLSRCVREGDEVVVIDGSETVTPSQAAERLGMSRTHLYKLLDCGEIAFHRVGRDRRIRVHDLLRVEEQRQRDRRELADRFDHQEQTALAATNEIADLL
jgi:excisionase family DNA binding protein